MVKVYDPKTGEQKEQTAPQSVTFDSSINPRTATNASVAQSTTRNVVPTLSNTQSTVSNVSQPVTPKTTTGYTQASTKGVIKGTAWDTDIPGVGASGSALSDSINGTQSLGNTPEQIEAAAQPIQPKVETPEDRLATLTKQKEAQGYLVEDAKLDKEILDASKLVEQNKKTTDYLKSQKSISDEITRLGAQNQEIAGSQRIAAAADKVASIKQNVGFLGTGGQPGKSSGALAAVEKQIRDSEQLYRKVIQTEDNLKTISKLGVEYDAAAFENQLDNLQTDLDSKVNTTLQSILSQFQAESGEIDTMEELQAAREKRLNTADNSIEGLTNNTLRQLERNYKVFEDRVKAQEEIIKGKNTVNKELSAAKGFYVDGNGDMLVGVDGKPIRHALDAPEDPIFDKETGKMFTSSLGPNGETIRTATQVVPQEVFAAETIQNIVSQVKNGLITPKQAIELVPRTGREALLQQLADVKPYIEPKAPANINPEVIGQDEDGNPIYGYVDPYTRRVVTIDAGGGSVKSSTGGGQIRLNETPVDIDLVSTYGNKVKLAPTVGNMVLSAAANLKNQGINLKIADSYRSNAAQAASYNSGKAGVAPPGSSFHELGQAFDLAQTKEMKDERVFQALRDAGLQQLPGEWWHWSYGEMGGNTNTTNQNLLDTILGSGKFTKDQTKAIKNAVNNGEDPVTVIKNQAKSILGAAESGKLTNYEVAKGQIQDIQSLLKQYYASGGKTGVFSGNYEKVLNKLGEVDDPKLVSLATQIASALQVYRNAVSGTAYSEQEGQDIAGIFPGINKSEGLNAAVINGRLAAFDSTIDGYYRSVLGSTYDKLKGGSQITTPPPIITPNKLANPVGAGNVSSKTNADYLSSILP